MKTQPLVSVLMPVYNGEKYLKEAIDSVLAQTYKKFELIIINDGSVDNTEDIILSFSDTRIRYIKNETNLKLIETLNKGIQLSNGKYIARIDADDVCMRNRLKIQVSFLEKNINYALCGSWAYIINSDSKITGRIKRIDDNGLLKASLLFTCPFLHPSILIRTEIIKHYLYDKTALHCEDYELWLRIGNSSYQMANIPKYLIKYRWHNQNISVENEEFQYEQKRKIIKPYLEDYLHQPISMRDMDYHFYSFQLYKFNDKKHSKINLTLNEEKKWLKKCSVAYQNSSLFTKKEINALLWSRWIVCCLYHKKYYSIFSIDINKWNIIIKTLKLLINK